MKIIFRAKAYVIEAALLLIEHGFDVDKLDHMRNSPLERCAASNSLDDGASARLARELLAQGADPNHVGGSDCTPIELAEIREKPLMAEVLRAFT